MKKLLIILIFIVNLANAQEGQIVRLNDCYESMLANYPLAKQTGIYAQSNDLNIKNLKAGWLPNAEFKAQATYQSDVMELNLDLPGTFTLDIDLPEMPKDQYKATIDINQLIYDWGRIKSAKQLENANLQVNEQGVKVELNKIKEQINRFYFAIILFDSNEELLNVMLKDLEAKEKSVESAVNNGVLLNSDLSALKAEIIKLKQNVKELQNHRLAAIEVLAEITGLELSENSQFEKTEYDIKYNNESNRPELLLFDYQNQKLGVTSQFISKQNKPMFFAFSQLGYGKPGLNMLNEDFDSYYYVGVGMSWEFWDWNKTKRNKQVVVLNQELISTQKNTFSTQIEIALRNERSKIKNFEEAIKSDQEIIKLREEVTESARSKLDNGIITSTEYITELSKETRAKIDYETHKIQLIQSKVNYLYIKGEI